MGQIRPRALSSDLLQDLSECGFGDIVDAFRVDSTLKPWPDIGLKEIQVVSLLNSFMKKFHNNETSNGRDSASLSKFISVNNRCDTWTYTPVDSWDEVLYGELQNTLYHFFYPSGEPLIRNMGHIFSNAQHGPKATQHSDGQDLYSKFFSSEMSSTTEGLYRAYRCHISNFPRWEAADNFRSDHRGKCKVVEGNQLRFVPKTRDISRLIAVEPTLNMYCQLGIGSILEDRLKTFFGIDLSSQPEVNRELAKRGSFDDSFSTIDLESASDSMSCKMIASIVPKDQLGYFNAVRSPSMVLLDGNKLALNMISTMGNGFTFPLQTCIFSAIIVASARARGFPLGRPRADSDGTWSVFGDDMIVPTGCHYMFYRGENVFVNYGKTLLGDVSRLLRLLGFIMNNDKTFLEGPFRESCGYDSFRGHNVRGVYIKKLLTPQDRVVAANQLNEWTARTGIVLARTVRRLLCGLRFPRVPIWESEDAGLRCSFSLAKNDVHRRDGHILYKVWESRARYFIVRDGNFEGNFGNRLFNHDGLLLAFLAGTIRSCKVSVNSRQALYRSRTRSCGLWDRQPSSWLPDGAAARLVPALSAGGLQSYKTAVSLNTKLLRGV